MSVLGPRSTMWESLSQFGKLCLKPCLACILQIPTMDDKYIRRPVLGLVAQHTAKHKQNTGTHTKVFFVHLKIHQYVIISGHFKTLRQTKSIFQKVTEPREMQA